MSTRLQLTAHHRDSLESPLGNILIHASERCLLRVEFTSKIEKLNPSPLTRRAAAALKAYFKGEYVQFDFPIDLSWGTEFQQETWQALKNISFGEAYSYGDVARMINRPKAVRAVGVANSKNPIAIIIPCHRVIGSQGQLTGYAGGLEKKMWLLEHEGIPFKRQEKFAMKASA